MSKRCAKCEKTVYPIEELKCLDKAWHKTCFKCESCGMTLNMKNYKGYNKLPYCNAHYPTTKFTAVADTPEMARLAQNTKNQSNLSYHADFEKQKGKFTQVADDPETLRLMQNSQKFSAISYHSEFEQSKGKYISVADDPEILRVLKNQENISSIKYHEDFEKNIKGTKIQVENDPETQRVMDHSKVVSQVEYKGLKQQQYDQEQKRASIPQDNEPAHLSRRQPGSVSDYNPAEHQPSPYSSKFQAGQSTMYTSSGQTVEQPRSRRIGSITDYDPMKDQWGSSAPGQQAQYTGAGQQWEEQVQLPRQNQDQPSSPRRPPVGGVPMVPVNQPLSLMVHRPEEKDTSAQQPQYYPAPAQNQPPPPQPAYQPPPQSYQPPPQSYQPPPQQSYQPPAPAPAPAPSRKGPMYTAMYDYDAQDDDEISFRDGDAIVDTEAIDDGWMFGTVQRTGQRGMLPSNYVERA